jgi:DNA mismatch endonuclease (patch repair protein)
MPSTRTDFWEAKIARNRERDRDVCRAVLEGGWRYLVIWECALKGRNALNFDLLIARIETWLCGDQDRGEIAGS